MDNYWDSFDCQIQCEEVYTKNLSILDLEDTNDENQST